MTYVNLVEEVKSLLAIESITGNEKELAYYLIDRFKSIGCKTTLFEAAPGRFNITAVIEGNNSGKLGLLPALTEINSKIVEYVKKAHSTVKGSNPVIFFTDGYQEMDFLVNDLGIESIQYGPGDSSLCHTDYEQLSISDLKSCSGVYLELIRLICE